MAMTDSEKRKILVVDDDPLISDLLVEFCTDLGYEARSVNQSPSALAVALEFKPQLITLDLEMPGMDGIEVLKALRSHPDTQRIPVVIISVVAKEAGIAPGLVEGLFDKPIKFRNLMQRINGL